MAYLMKQMKRILLPILLILICLSPLFSYSQKTYRVDSEVWQAINALTLSQGVLPPSSVSPVSEEELLGALDRLDIRRLSPGERSLYDEILKKIDSRPLLDGRHVDLDVNPVLSPELYVQTTAVPRQMDHAYDIKDMLSLINLSTDIYLSDFGFAFADYYFISPGLASQYDKIFGTNMDEFPDFQHEGILNAGILFGKSFINASIMKTRQSMGYGKTGNLMVGDNFSRQDYGRLHIYSEYFDYTMNFTHFDTSTQSSGSGNDVSFSERKLNGMQQWQGVHRFEAKLFNRLQFVFQEGVMLYSSKAFSPILLNPFLYFHGLYNFSESPNIKPGESSDEANNYIVVELGYTAARHLRFNLQFLMDQIQQPDEGKNPDGCPQAYGMLFNIESPWILRDGTYLTPWFESAWIMPYTYLNKKWNGSGYDTNLDMITGYHNNLQDEVGYAGYKYGSDSIVNAIGITMGRLGLYKFDSSISYIIHGRYGYGYDTIIPERGEDHRNDMMLAGVGFSGAEHRLEIETEVSYFPVDGLELRMGMAIYQIWNHQLVKGRSLTDLQLKIGISFDPVEMFAK